MCRALSAAGGSAGLQLGEVEVNRRRLRLILVLVAGFFVMGGIQAPSALADTCSASSASPSSPSAIKTFPCDCELQGSYQDDAEHVWIARCSEIGTGTTYDHCFSFDLRNWLCEGRPADGSLPNPLPLGTKTPDIPPVVLCSLGGNWSDGSSLWGVQAILGTNRNASRSKTLHADWGDGTYNDYTIPPGNGVWFATPIHSYTMSGGSAVWVDLNGGHGGQAVGYYGMVASRSIMVTDYSTGKWGSCGTWSVDP
jgi:hypothetical protein